MNSGVKVSGEKIFRLLFWTGYAAILITSFIPLKKDLHKITFGIASVEFHFDQVLHTVVYFLICLYNMAGERFGLKLFDRIPGKKFLAAMLVLAVITELIQSAVPSRNFNLADVAANLAGIGLGQLLNITARRKRPIP